MNIDVKAQSITNTTNTTSATKNMKNDGTKFADELSNLRINKSDEDKDVNNQTKRDENKSEVVQAKEGDKQNSANNEKSPEEDMTVIINGLQGVVEEINKTKPNINQIGDKNTNKMKKEDILSDNEHNNADIFDDNEDNALINNDMNIQEPQDKFNPQMNAQMNFNSNGQPFSSFIQQPEQSDLTASEKDLAEENAILSTMAENIAIANKNTVLSPKKEITKDNQQKAMITSEITNANEIQEDSIEESKQKTVTNEHGIKKVDIKNNITVETVVKYDTVIMNSDDVEFFTKLVENGSVDLNTQSQNVLKSSQVSKTLADLIAKAMNENQPVRIDFDNDISVIIKISKDGKISADFLPSSQVAEAYLKENLPILKQRFDENNIDYDELNQRKQQRQDDRDNRKKGRKDE